MRLRRDCSTTTLKRQEAIITESAGPNPNLYFNFLYDTYLRPQFILDFFHGGLQLFRLRSESIEARISARLEGFTLRSFKLLRLSLATGNLLQWTPRTISAFTNSTFNFLYSVAFSSTNSEASLTAASTAVSTADLDARFAAVRERYAASQRADSSADMPQRGASSRGRSSASRSFLEISSVEKFHVEKCINELDLREDDESGEFLHEIDELLVAAGCLKE